jgi:hypothetical protein
MPYADAFVYNRHLTPRRNSHDTSVSVSDFRTGPMSSEKMLNP